MTDLNDFFYTDGVHDVLAAYVNQLVAGNLRGELSNIETLTANKTLTNASFPIQSVVASGANRDVTLPAVAAANHGFMVMNRATTLYSINVKNAGGTIIATLRPGAVMFFASDGTNNWYCSSGLSTAGGQITGVLNAIQLDVRKLAGQTADVARFGDGATDYLAIQSTGKLKLFGTAVVSKDMFADGLSLTGGATDPPTFAAMQNGIYGRRYDDAATMSAHGTLELQHDYADGTDIELHVHWRPTTTNTGNCRWGIEYSVANMNATYPASTTVYVNTPGSGVIGRHQYATVGTIVGTGLTHGAVLLFRIFRDGTNVLDTFTGNAFLLRVAGHYTANQLGS